MSTRIFGTILVPFDLHKIILSFSAFIGWCLYDYILSIPIVLPLTLDMVITTTYVGVM